MSWPGPCCTKEKMIHWCHICKTKRCPQYFPETSIRISRCETIVCVECADEVVSERREHEAKHALKVLPELNVEGTQTGRLSSSSLPNLGVLPARRERLWQRLVALKFDYPLFNQPRTYR